MNPSKNKFLLTIVLFHYGTPICLADWIPQIYNAIKWTAPNQGQQTIAYTTQQGITRVPMAYHGGVDTNASGVITDKNIEVFTDWAHTYLPENYCGPVVMDYEQPWWKELLAREIMPQRLQEILSVYVQGVQTAKNVQPNAQWGYWGLPALRNTSEKWLEQGLSMESLTSQCNALYPDVYNCTPGKDRAKHAQEHISKVLQEAGGKIPVYVFASVRYCGPDVEHSDFVPDDIFLKQVNAALRAFWTDENGTQHRVRGIILWDAYGFSPEEEWEALDQKHTYFFTLLQALSQAWAKSMQGKHVATGALESPECIYGMPEPLNSSGGIYDQSSRDKREKLRPNEIPAEPIENDRIPSGRIRGDRIQ